MYLEYVIACQVSPACLTKVLNPRAHRLGSRPPRGWPAPRPPWRPPSSPTLPGLSSSAHLSYMHTQDSTVEHHSENSGDNLHFINFYISLLEGLINVDIHKLGEEKTLMPHYTLTWPFYARMLGLLKYSWSSMGF